jgi:hypothetical protein
LLFALRIEKNLRFGASSFSFIFVSRVQGVRPYLLPQEVRKPKLGAHSFFFSIFVIGVQGSALTCTSRNKEDLRLGASSLFFHFCCRYVGCAALTYILRSKEKPRPWSLGFFFFVANVWGAWPQVLIVLLKKIRGLEPQSSFVDC